MKVEIKDNKKFVRDTTNMAVINTNKEGRKHVLAVRRQKLNEQNELKTLRKEVDDLKTIIKDLIKDKK